MPHSKITLKEVGKVAKLARLELRDEELLQAQHELDAILGYIEELSTLDVSDVEPTFHAIPIAARLRRDDRARCINREEALAQAPESDAGAFSVPRVLEVE